ADRRGPEEPSRPRHRARSESPHACSGSTARRSGRPHPLGKRAADARGLRRDRPRLPAPPWLHGHLRQQLEGVSRAAATDGRRRSLPHGSLTWAHRPALPGRWRSLRALEPDAGWSVAVRVAQDAAGGDLRRARAHPGAHRAAPRHRAHRHLGSQRREATRPGDGVALLGKSPAQDAGRARRGRGGHAVMSAPTRVFAAAWGAVTPVGASAKESALAFRASVNALRESAIPDATGAAITMGLLPTLSPELEGIPRLVALADLALMDLLQSAHALLAGRDVRLALVLDPAPAPDWDA